MKERKENNMKMYVPFYYEKMGRIEVEADSVKEAQEKAQDILDEMSWKDCGRLAECVDDSAQIDYDGIILDENQNIVEKEILKSETRDYLISCIEADEDLYELGYHENESFINDVVERYESNLKYVDDEYSEIDAKDDAIRAAADFRAEMNRIARDA